MCYFGKKGFATTLVDFYATIAIILIIIVFFIILHYKTENVKNTITGEELGLDATRLALLYAQTPVETSLGTITFAQFLVAAAENEFLEEEYVAATELYFEELQEETNIAIVVVRVEDSEETEDILIQESIDFSTALCVKNPLLFLLSNTCVGYSTLSAVRIPLHDTNNYALIEVQTKIK